jgi:hypothetical protein
LAKPLAAGRMHRAGIKGPPNRADGRLDLGGLVFRDTVVDVFTAQGFALAEERIKRIAQLYGVQKEVRGQSSEARAPCGRPGPNPFSRVWRCGFRLSAPKYPATVLTTAHALSREVGFGNAFSTMVLQGDSYGGKAMPTPVAVKLDEDGQAKHVPWHVTRAAPLPVSCR